MPTPIRPESGTPCTAETDAAPRPPMAAQQADRITGFIAKHRAVLQKLADR